MAPPKKKFSELGRTARYYRRAEEGLKIKGKKTPSRSHYDKRIAQQTRYERTPYGGRLKKESYELQEQLKKQGKKKPSKHHQAGHYASRKGGRRQDRKSNAARKPA